MTIISLPQRELYCEGHIVPRAYECKSCTVDKRNSVCPNFKPYVPIMPVIHDFEVKEETHGPQ